ncbi:hypothetical protein [Rhizobium phaseoli]|uniref:hypothetical protein n=1 Tax=Rhizobium phaseoli TaxID=396 RepID=UPI000AF9FA30|nr:hypothetical protein [Rhizobium phaseoli]
MAIASFKVVLQGRVQDFTIIIVAEIYRPPLINLLNPRRGRFLAIQPAEFRKQQHRFPVAGSTWCGARSQ